MVPVTARQVGPCTATCPLRVTVPGLRSDDRLDIRVAGATLTPSGVPARSDGTVDVTDPGSADPHGDHRRG